jgi:ribonucleoside-triphosphate reductase
MKEEKKIVEVNRIRRITGYLIPTIEKWNNSKRAELKDRVKHFSKNSEN